MSDGRGWPFEPVDRGGPAVSTAVAEPVVLSARPPDPPSEPPLPAVRAAPFVVLVVVLTVALLLGGFAVVDWWSRNHELGELLDRIETAEAAQRPIQRALGQYQAACMTGVGRCDRGAVQAAALRALPPLRSAGGEVAGTSIVRYHGALRELRDRYVDHNLAWVAWVEEVSTGDASTERPTDIQTTWYVVMDAAREAVPPFPTGDARRRVEEIFHL
jgi:hypothetical protein